MDHHPLPLREQLKVLVNLQEVDLKIDSLKKKKFSLPSHLKTINDTLQKSQAAISLKNTALAEIEKSLRQTQAALELNQDRLKRAHGKLEGVHNSQEFQAANKEIDQLKKLNSTLEEQLKKSKTEVGAIQTEIENMNLEISVTQEEQISKAALISSESSQINTQISSLEQERLQFVPNMNKRILALYDRVRVARNGLGLVPALNGRCSGCNLSLPPQLFNEIMKYNNAQSCPNCNRILFVPEQNLTPPASEETVK